ELLVYPLRKIDQPPAHDTVDRRDRAALDHPHNRLALHIIEPRGLAWRFTVKQAGSPPRIEPHHPAPNDLQRHATKPRRLGQLYVDFTYLKSATANSCWLCCCNGRKLPILPKSA